MFVQNFKILGAVVLEKSLTKDFIGEKEKMDKQEGHDGPISLT